MTCDKGCNGGWHTGPCVSMLREMICAVAERARNLERDCPDRYLSLDARMTRLEDELHPRCKHGRLVSHGCSGCQDEKASGQPASAGEAPLIPPGWKLAPGWIVRDGFGWRCSNGWEHSRRFECTEDAPYERGADGACAAHAVELGALVKDEPPAAPCGAPGPMYGAPLCSRPRGHEQPHRGGDAAMGAEWTSLDEPPAEQPIAEDVAFTCANCGPGAEPDDLGDCVKCQGDLTGVPAEQPSRQETPGGECPGCACCNDDSCPTRHTDCETLCRDRVKAKAAEQAPSRAEWLARPMARYDYPPPAEPSGAGQVASAPVGGVERFSLDEIRTAYQQALPHETLWMLLRQALWGLPFTQPVAEPPATAFPMDQIEGLPTPPRPPATAAGTLSERVRALRFPLTLGEARNVDGLADEVAALGVRLAQAEAAIDIYVPTEEQNNQRGDWLEEIRRAIGESNYSPLPGAVRTLVSKFAQAERERDELADDIEYVRQQHARVVSECRGHQVQLTEEAGKAVSSERARCVGWLVVAGLDDTRMANDIRSGQPAPGTVEPNCATAGKVEP